MNINVFILKNSGGEKLLIESVRFPDATADETADLLATGVDPTKELLSLILGDAVATLHVFRMAVADSQHTDAILIGRQSHTLEFLNGCDQCAAGSHTISFDGSMSAVAVPEGTGLSGRMVFSISSHSDTVTRTRFLHLRSPH